MKNLEYLSNILNEATNAVKEASTEKAKEIAQKYLDDIRDMIRDEGRTFITVFEAYQHTVKYENEILDFYDLIQNTEIEPLISCMKKQGIKEFTYSCKATNVIETLFQFQQAGCIIGELVTVNTGIDYIKGGHEYVKDHAFKMTIN